MSFAHSLYLSETPVNETDTTGRNWEKPQNILDQIPQIPTFKNTKFLGVDTRFWEQKSALPKPSAP